MLLLDEIEKAHPDLFNILLQVMDHGKLTDHNGKQVDFRNVIIIMTTNAGASDMARPAMGFTRAKREGDDTEAINKLFAPEFRNRSTHAFFSHLPAEVIQKVVDKFVMQLEAQLADRNVTIELTDESRDWLVEHGYDEAMGARPMACPSRRPSRRRSPTTCFGRLKEGGAVRVVKTSTRSASSRLPEYLEGPVIPKPEKDVSNAARRSGRSLSKAYSKPKKAGSRKAVAKGGGVRTVPKVPAGPRMTIEARLVPLLPAGTASRPRTGRRDAGGREASGSRTVEEVLGAGELGTPAPAGLV